MAADMRAHRHWAHRYSRVAMALHWIIALLVIAMIPMGIWMSGAINDPARQATAYRLFQLHKSIGLTILVLTLARGLWRVRRPPPPGAPSLKPWERFLSRATHAAFYAILLLLPLSGWVYVSSGWAVSTDQPLNVATSFFGLFQIPHIAPVAHADGTLRRIIAFRSMGFHWAMSLGTIVLIVLHVAGALKHQFLDRDGSLASMVPWLAPAQGAPPSARRGKPLPALIGAVVVIAMSAGAAALGLTYDPRYGTGSSAAGKTAGAAAASTDIPGTVEPGRAPLWTIADGAALTFSGTHAGAPFKGGFRRWTAHVYFDPSDLAGSRIVILIETGSVFTGDATQEGTLAEGEWFDVARQPRARFDSAAIASLGGDRYSVAGTLRVKDRRVPVKIDAHIRITGSHAEADGRFDLDRTALDLGMASDPTAMWVSRTIPMRFSLKADRR